MGQGSFVNTPIAAPAMHMLTTSFVTSLCTPNSGHRKNRLTCRQLGKEGRKVCMEDNVWCQPLVLFATSSMGEVTVVNLS